MGYKIKKSKRAKRIRISISHSEGIVITIPYGFSEKIANRFIEEKKDWIKSKIKLFNNLNKIEIKHSRKDYLEKKEKARKLVLKRISILNFNDNFVFNRISIKNQNTRWGSCSGKKNLNFNYRMIYLPERLFDYIIIHELCHLKELNHSKSFWNLVFKYCPEYIKEKKELKNFLL